MRLALARRASFWLAAATLSATYGCGGASFAGGGMAIGQQQPTESEGQPTVDNGTAFAPDIGAGTGTSTGTEAPEGTPATEPQQVTGAFLTCVPETLVASGATAAAKTFGCSINPGKHSHADLASAQITWSLQDAQGQPLTSQATFSAMPPGSLWQTELSLTAAQAAGDQVIANVLWPDTSTPEGLRTTLSDNGQEPTDWHVTSGTVPYHLGNGFFSASGCLTTLTDIPLSGAAMSLALTVQGSAPTSVQISVSGLCGVDYDQVSTLAVTDASGNLVAQTVLRRHAHGAYTDPVTLSAGTYSISVAAGAYEGDLDDFILTDLFVRATQPVMLAAPQFSGSSSGQQAPGSAN